MFVQAPAADAATTDEKKKDALLATEGAVVLAQQPAPVAAPMPVCR
jgi:hypothetical protein